MAAGFRSGAVKARRPAGRPPPTSVLWGPPASLPRELPGRARAAARLPSARPASAAGRDSPPGGAAAPSRVRPRRGPAVRRLVGPPEGSSRERGGWVRLGLTLSSAPTPWAQAGRARHGSSERPGGRRERGRRVPTDERGSEAPARPPLPPRRRRRGPPLGLPLPGGPPKPAAGAGGPSLRPREQSLLSRGGQDIGRRRDLRSDRGWLSRVSGHRGGYARPVHPAPQRGREDTACSGRHPPSLHPAAQTPEAQAARLRGGTWPASRSARLDLPSEPAQPQTHGASVSPSAL